MLRCGWYAPIVLINKVVVSGLIWAVGYERALDGGRTPPSIAARPVSLAQGYEPTAGGKACWSVADRRRGLASGAVPRSLRTDLSAPAAQRSCRPPRSTEVAARSFARARAGRGGLKDGWKGRRIDVAKVSGRVDGLSGVPNRLVNNKINKLRQWVWHGSLLRYQHKACNKATLFAKCQCVPSLCSEGPTTMNMSKAP